MDTSLEPGKPSGGKNTLAVVSLVVGLVTLTLGILVFILTMLPISIGLRNNYFLQNLLVPFGMFCAIPIGLIGFFAGLVSFRQIKNNNQAGRSTAIGGVVTSLLGILANFPFAFLSWGFMLYAYFRK